MFECRWDLGTTLGDANLRARRVPVNCPVPHSARDHSGSHSTRSRRAAQARTSRITCRGRRSGGGRSRCGGRSAFVVDAQQVQDRGVEVVAVGLALGGLPRPVVALAVATPALTPAPASQATDVPPLWSRPGRSLGERHPAELGRPDDQRVVEQAAGLEVLRRPAIGWSTVRAIGGSSVGMSAWLSQLFARPAGAAPDLDEPDAALEQAAGEQAAAAEVLGGRVVEAVELAGRGGSRRRGRAPRGRSSCIRAASSYDAIRASRRESPGVRGGVVGGSCAREQCQALALGSRRRGTAPELGREEVGDRLGRGRR